MRDKKHILRVLLKGGILTPGVLIKLCELASMNENKVISFGSRQDILFDILPTKKTEAEDFLTKHAIDFEWKSDSKPKTQNIVSSFVANDVFQSTTWVNPGAYQFILEGFNYHPKIKINVVDPVQKLVPHFSGHLNFIASTHEDYWHLFIRRSGEEQMIEWPELIYSADVPAIARHLEGIAFNNKSVSKHQLIQTINDELKLNTLSNFETLKRSPNFPPYYEGIHKMASGNDLWAGFYWRNNKYSIRFIENVCSLCLQTGIARISITPWKSFLVKNIKQEHRLMWEQMIGHFGINMRHSSFELYWHLPFANKEALQLRRYLVQQFDKVDIRTFGLTFSIGQPDIPFTSVVIKKRWYPNWFNWLNLFKTYSIYYAKDFNPESNQYLSYRKSASFKELPKVLIELSKKYYASLPELKSELSKPMPIKIDLLNVHQCKACLSVYVPQIGDELLGIDAGTTFTDLPEEYKCSCCGADKSAFEEQKMRKELFVIK